MNEATRACMNCGEPFRPSNPRALCCSRRCTVVRNNAIQNAKKHVHYAETPVCGLWNPIHPRAQ